MIEWVAACHVHSTYSDGSADMEDIVSAAADAGLEVVLSADHNTLNVKREGWEGWRRGVLVVAAAEVGATSGPHCLAFGVRHCCGYADAPPAEYLSGIRAQGGFAIVAHPSGLERPLLGIHKRGWALWEHPTVSAFELWSYPHDWARNLLSSRVRNPIDALRHPDRLIRGPSRSLLRTWDRHTPRRRLSVIGSIDSHADYHRLLNLTLFPHAQMFRTVRTHFFVSSRAGDGRDVDQVVAAIREGKCFVAYDYLADSRGTWAEAETAGGKRLLMGDEAPHDGPTRLRLRLPRTAEVALVRNGRPRVIRTTDRFEFLARCAGVYRFEVRLDGRPWIFTNPFYLRSRL